MINVKNLTKKFGEFIAVDNISFEIKAGEIFAFLGPNGAGKSTTIKMITTLLRQTAGEIHLNNTDTLKKSAKARQFFGVVFQDPSLDDELTAYENMHLHAVLYHVPREKRTARIQEMLEFTELWDRKDSLVGEFSGGMKRRLEIARGLLHFPKIFFLDEPTIGLDPQTRNHMWNYIKELNKREGTTIFVTTHYMEEAEKYADRLAIIDHGKIIASGTVAEIKKQTNTTTLEEAFLQLTGHSIREEQGAYISPFMRMRRGK